MAGGMTMDTIRIAGETLINLCFLKVSYNKPDAPGAIHTGENRDAVYISMVNEDIPKAFTDMTGLAWVDTNTVNTHQLFHADGTEITAEDLKMFADIGSFVQTDFRLLKPSLKKLSLSEEGIREHFFREMPTISVVGAATAPSAPCPCGSNLKFKKCCQFK